MLVRFTFLAACVTAVVSNAWAQTSTARIEPSEGGAPAVVIAKSVEMTEMDYPLEALLANQEGKVTLEFSVDPGGHAANLRLVSSSGVPLLDRQAVRLAATRWTFEPMGASARLNVDWKLPLQAVDQFAIEIPQHPANAIPPRAIKPHSVTATDYPPVSLRGKEFGIVGLRYVIKEDGSVSDVQIAQTSGVMRLDEAAVRMVVSRWNFEPAKVDGTAVPWSAAATMAFYLLPDILDKKYLRCYAKPVWAEEPVLIMASLIGRTGPSLRPLTDRWTFVNQAGEVSDVLLSANQGLRRPTGTLLQALKGNGYRKPESSNGCWYYDPVFVPQ